MRRPRIMFVFWGRRGALTRFTLEVGQAALKSEELIPLVSVSRQNENFAAFQSLGTALFPVDTFSSDWGAAAYAWRIPLLRRQLYRRIRQDRIDAVVELMAHVWSPFVMPVVRHAGARYVVFIHDAVAHPGDRTAWAKSFLHGAMAKADVVATLSRAVAGRLQTQGLVPPDRIATLFHPDFDFGPKHALPPPRSGEPVRLLFLGRVMAYKGLPLFLDVAEMLRREGIPVEVGVFGEGQLGDSAARLEALGAEVVNRWLTEDEIGRILPRFHALVLSHTEASQSGVAAAAFGAGLPVVALPVGGIVEQVVDGKTGLLAKSADAPALAAAVKRLLLDPELYGSTCRRLVESRGERSMARFVSECVRIGTGSKS